ncbi:MAG TPA: cyanophycin synthetase, partial [Gammaproteobacteria bacterium]|nr:cyanophycin synthetase [Gammaproteobacteria bacterium]
IAHEGNLWLSKGAHRFMKTAELGMIGQHNALNALVSLAMGERLGFDQAAMIEVLKTFRGLEHRAEVVAKSQGVTWINDSKGTNTGACLAAIQGLGGEGEKNIHLIMGGRSKGADFSILQSAIQKVVKYLYLIGECADDLQKQFKDSVPIFLARNLETAVDLAQERIEPGDIVLLSPACASFDQYSNYIERGEHFSRLVHKRLKGKTE